ncbi:hypothetical protein JCM1841_003523 [Sporobolomyces salmonicolor]
MVLLQLTPPLRARLDVISPLLPGELRERVGGYLVVAWSEQEDGSGARRKNAEGGVGTGQEQTQRGSGTVPHELLVDVSRWARTKEDLPNSDRYTLASLLRLTDVHAPPLAPREKSPELLAILSAIQLQQDRQTYAALTSLSSSPYPSSLPLTDPHDPAFTGRRAKTVAEEWDEIRREVGAIVNVGASMAAVGTAVWWVGGGRSYAARLSLALLGALAIAVIEGFLYYRFFTRQERESTEMERRTKRRGGGGVLRFHGGGKSSIPAEQARGKEKAGKVE